MIPGLLVAALVIAVLTVAFGVRQVFWGRPSGWPGVGLIVVVSISVLIVALAALAVILYLVLLVFPIGWAMP